MKEDKEKVMAREPDVWMELKKPRMRDTGAPSLVHDSTGATEP